MERPAKFCEESRTDDAGSGEMKDAVFSSSRRGFCESENHKCGWTVDERVKGVDRRERLDTFVSLEGARKRLGNVWLTTGV